jgi:shikimate kinase
MNYVKHLSLETGTPDLVFLVGFMGSGKTTIGKSLAKRIGFQFLDLDKDIESRAGRTINEIFAQSGEAHFRKLERQAIELCRGLKKTVVALGGGAYISEVNRALLSSIGVTVWLNCPLRVCITRMGKDKNRPLLSNRTDLRSLYERRRSAYARADFMVYSVGKSPGEVAKEIIAELFGYDSK